MLVREVMTPDPVVADATSTIFEVIERMQEEDIRHMPVLDRGQLVGVISDRDLKAYSFEAVMSNPEGAQGRLRRPISLLMSGDPISVEAEADLGEAVDLILENKIGAVPVIDPEGNVVGIVSYVDVLRAARELL